LKRTATLERILSAKVERAMDSMQLRQLVQASTSKSRRAAMTCVTSKSNWQPLYAAALRSRSTQPRYAAEVPAVDPISAALDAAQGPTP